MKKQYYIFSLIILIQIVGCKKEKKDPVSSPTTIKFSLTGAKAIIYDKNTGTKTAGTADEGGTLLKMDENGVISSAVEGITISSFKRIPAGLYVVTSHNKKYFVKPDNSYYEIDVNANGSYILFIGCNSIGELIFSDLSVFNPSTLSTRKINSSLLSPRILRVSGDYAVISDFDAGIGQIVNTITGIRYNIANCNGSRIFDLDSGKVFVNDCSNAALMDMTTGNRTAMNKNDLVGEAITISSGHIICSNGFSSGNWELGRIDSDSVYSISSVAYSVTPTAGTCWDCENKILFGEGDNVVVKEFTQVSIFNITNNTRTIIMAGYNVISVSVKDNKVYFLAENNMGDPTSGIYDLVTSTYTLSNSSNYYDVIEAF